MKHVQRLISAMLCILIVCSFSVVVIGPLHTHAEGGTSEQTQTPSYMEMFFRNLEDFGYNKHGSCGYIALGMVLLYYDSFWDNNLIDDDYVLDGEIEVTEAGDLAYFLAPGTAWDALAYEDYYEYCQAIYNHNPPSFHGYLLSLGEEYHNVEADIEEGEYYFGLYPGDQADLLREYLQIRDNEVESFSATDWEITSVVNRGLMSYWDDSEVREAVIGYIQQGYPVLICADYENTINPIRGLSGMNFFEDEEATGRARHALVAYDYEYDSETGRNIIYAHTGWPGYSENGDDYAHMDVDALGTGQNAKIYAYSVLKPVSDAVEHIHNNNHKVTVVDGDGHPIEDQEPTYVCSCQLSTHQHEQWSEILLPIPSDPNRQLYHYYFCYCEAKINEGHIYESIGLNKRRCVKCSYTVTISSFIPVIKKIEPEEEEETE